MKRGIAFLLLVMLMMSMLVFVPAAQAATRLNNYPIVLVHGLGGFDKLLGMNYWGGVYNVQSDLISRGYPTYIVAMGPVSSNWDRACELYAQIKGGTVDYGKAHAAKYGHARFGRTYPGFYPQWGTTDPATGKINKVHLIGHSMGGQTSRTLVQILSKGNADEIAATPASELSTLFKGGNSWVRGVLTMSTPHDGSTFAYALLGTFPKLQQMITALATIAGPTATFIYDFKLDQWGIVKSPGESWDAYMKKVEQSGLWSSTKDIASWDLTPEGALELNGWVKAQADVYYFSLGTQTTYRELFTGHEIATLSMNPLWWGNAAHMGAYTQSGPVPVDKTWWKNDGWVNLISMNGPKNGSTDQIVNYNGIPQIGKWNYLGVKNGIDHTTIVGIGTLWDPRPTFRDLADKLGSVPE
ncbi:MAG: esterase/lipase family protein [Acidobacteriota bacterium]